MGSIFLTELASWLRNAGLSVIEYDGWQTRSRGSGGYNDYPLCVMWHHTASPASWDGKKDADYCATGDTDSPLSNLYIDRSGTVWILAAGATNTNGKGNSLSFSRGNVPTDSMNTHALGVEMGNDGIGELWPQSQIDAMFIVSNTCNARFGNRPDDIATHNYYAPTRKIDPATDNVEGPWIPTTCNSSRSWDRSCVQAECMNRSGQPIPIPPQPIPPQPTPPQPEDDDAVTFDGFWQRDNDGTVFALFTDGTKKWVGNENDLAAAQALYRIRGCADEEKLSVRVQPDASMFTAFGIVFGPLPNDGVNRDEWGNVC